MQFLSLLAGLALLVVAGDALVRGAVALSLRLGISAVLVSVTIVGFGTSAPELLISVQAALAGSPGIALGNVVGSNIANVLLVLGVPAVLAPLAGCGREVHRNLYLMLMATALFAGLALVGSIGRLGAAALLGLALFMILDTLRTARATRGALKAEALAEAAEFRTGHPGMDMRWIALLIGAGILGLPLGAHLLIEGARSLAASLGISEAAIGLTVVAVGTSLPELATSVVAALRRHSDVAIGNVVGSNIFNITAIAGTAAMVHPLAVPAEIISRDLWCMIAVSLLLVPFVLLRHRIGRRAGTAFLALYCAYGYFALAG
jgi:cation:H+ antiporter